MTDAGDLAAAPEGATESTSRIQVFLLAAMTVSVGALMVLVAAQDVTDVGLLLRDYQTTTESPWYLGVISTAGILGWAVGATLFMVSAHVASRSDDREAARCLAIAGVGTAFLMLDDWWLIHDDWAQRQVNLEMPIFALYALGFVAWVVRFRRWLRDGPIGVLVFAAAVFAASVFIDVVLASSDTDTRLIAEEGTKLLGIGALALYAAVTLLGGLESPRSRDRVPAGAASDASH